MHFLLRLMVLCVFVGAVSAQDNKSDRKNKSAPIEVTDLKARRNDGVIEVVAQVRNSGEKPLKNVQIVFQFEDSGGNPISNEQMKIDETRLMPGSEASLNVQLRDSPRATQLHIGAEAGGGIILTVGAAGPYPIE